MARRLRLVAALGVLAALGLACAGQRESLAPVQDFRGVDDYVLWCASNNLWQEARAHLEAAVGADSTDAALFNNLAVVYEKWGLDDKALWAYDKARALAPSNRTVRENYMRFLHESGPEAALEEPPSERRPEWDRPYPHTHDPERRR